MGFHRIRVILKTIKNAILCHNWSLYAQKLVKILLKLSLGEKHGLQFSQSKGELS